MRCNHLWQRYLTLRPLRIHHYKDFFLGQKSTYSIIPFSLSFCYHIDKAVIIIETFFSHYYGYLKEKAINLEYHSYLDALYAFYTHRHPIDNQEIHSHLNSVETIISTLSTKRQRKLVHIIIDVCAAYERAAFIEGIQVGAQLIREITNTDE